jgi:hypothetical protein
MKAHHKAFTAIDVLEKTEIPAANWRESSGKYSRKVKGVRLFLNSVHLR